MSLLPLTSVAVEVRCTDISGENLQFYYVRDFHTGAQLLQLSLPSKIGEANFHSLRADYGLGRKVSYSVDTRTNDKGEVLASIHIPYTNELLKLQAVYHYPQCYSLLEVEFADGKRIK
jgi:hypothetical protein